MYTYIVITYTVPNDHALVKCKIVPGKSSVEQVETNCQNLKYFPLDEKDRWKVDLIKEVIDAKNDDLEVPGFEIDELETILHHLCTE